MVGEKKWTVFDLFFVETLEEAKTWIGIHHGTGKTATINAIFTNDTVRKCRAVMTRDIRLYENLSTFQMVVLCFARGCHVGSRFR